MRHYFSCAEVSPIRCSPTWPLLERSVFAHASRPLSRRRRMDISSVPPGAGSLVPGPMLSVGAEVLGEVGECGCEGEEERREIEHKLEEEDEEEAQAGGRKRVRFRDGVGMSLTAEFDDTNLWAHDPNETAHDMVDIYRRECSSLRVKPISKLLEQLERLDELDTPIDTLDLKGVRLDSRSCEVLEAVLSRMHMSTLDLERTNLEDEGAIALCEMVEFYGCTSKLILAQNSRLRPRAWLTIGRMLKKSPFLVSISVSYCGLEEQTLTLLLRSVRANCSLQVLKIEGNNLSGKGTFILMAAMKFNENLRELWLASNSLGAEDGQHLGSILRTNHTLHVLDVRDNSLQDAGVRYICAGIAEQQEGLHVLNLATNNISQEGIHHVSAMLPCTRTLRELNISHNRYGDNGLFMLKLGLLANRSIERLNLANTKMTCEGAIALAEVLAESKHLVHLDLRENDVRVAGLMALQLGHRMNHSLLVMDTPKAFRVDPRDRPLVRTLLGEIDNYCTRNSREREERAEDERRRQHEAQHAHLGTVETESPSLTAGLTAEGLPPEEEEKEVDPSLVGSLDDVYKDEPGEMGVGEDPFQRMPAMQQDGDKPASLMEMEKSMDALAVYTEEDGDGKSEPDESNMDKGVRSPADQSSTDRGVRQPVPIPNSVHSPPREAMSVPADAMSGDPDELPDLVGVSPNDLPPDTLPAPPTGHTSQHPSPLAPDVATGTAPTPDLAVGMATGAERVVDLLEEGVDPLSRVVDLTAGLAPPQDS